MNKGTAMLTTVDNPYNPFENFNEWFLFDIMNGYNSCSHLDRFAEYRNDLTQKEIDEETERAIDAFLSVDFTGFYKKVFKEDYKTAD